jgi:hypothetical protein
VAGSLYSLIYRSYARPPWIGDKSLRDIVEEAHAFNSEHDVTGVLIFSDGVFVQVLEGGTATILQLTARIAADRRNERLRVLWHGLVPERQFPDWSMGCFDMTDVPSGDNPVPQAVMRRGGEGPVWTDQMTEELISFYRENRVSGLAPMFQQMRRLS